MIKKRVLKAIKASSREAVFSSFRVDFPRGGLAKRMTSPGLQTLLVAFTTRHPRLLDCLCSDQGIGLMNIGSQIAALVQNWFMRKGNPCSLGA
ncbi:MAG: hypothetical protein IPL38_01300 [Rhodobacter sp.]|nr:hypothetical protein [Rhodobacter sp.]MBK8438191.1 hypothetical protein [Rhodobacter sp.]